MARSWRVAGRPAMCGSVARQLGVAMASETIGPPLKMGAFAHSRTEPKRGWSVACPVQPKGADHALRICHAVLGPVAFATPPTPPGQPRTQSAGLVQERRARRRAGGRG